MSDIITPIYSTLNFFKILHFLRCLYLTKYFDILIINRTDHHPIVFCYHCCRALRTNKLKKHCKKVHDTASRALRWGENPVEPIWLNWKDVIEQYPDTVPIRNSKVQVKHPSKRPLGKRSLSSLVESDVIESDSSKSAISQSPLASGSSQKMSNKAFKKGR